MSVNQSNNETYIAYKARWIILSQTQIVGVGLTPEQAYHRARTNRGRDKHLRLLYVDQAGWGHEQPASFAVWFEHPLLKHICHIFAQQNQEAYLVGGAVRDGLLGNLKPTIDFDLVVPEHALDIARHLANEMQAAYYPVDADRGVGRVILANKNHIDIAAYRGANLREDLGRRDFTINAIALSLELNHPKMFDPLGGQADLRCQIIRVASPTAFEIDPLRTIRAVRFAQGLGFNLDDATQALMPAQGPRLLEISSERLRDEVHKLLQGPRPSAAMQMLYNRQLLSPILPDIMAMMGVAQSPPHHLPVFEHSMQVIDLWADLQSFADERLIFLAPLRSELQAYFQESLAGQMSRASLMRWAAMFHDIGKPKTSTQGENGRIHFRQHAQVGAEITQTVLSQWRFSTQAIRFITTIVRHHRHPLFLAREKNVSQRAIYRFLKAARDAAPAIAILALLDHLGTYRPAEGQAEWQALSQIVLKICQIYFTPQAPILLTGHEIMQLSDLSPGPQIGQMIRALQEAQATGQVQDKAEAIQFVRDREARR